MAIVLALVMLLGVPRTLRHWRELRLARRPSQAPRAAATIWYERMVRLLRRHHLTKASSQTPQEFAKMIEAGTLRESVERFNECYEKARFGGSEDDASNLPRLYEEIESSAK